MHSKSGISVEIKAVAGRIEGVEWYHETHIRTGIKNVIGHLGKTEDSTNCN